MKKKDEVKLKAKEMKHQELERKAAGLAARFGVELIKYTCHHCLEKAYHQVIVGDKTGYVTDEELIASSGNRLQHM